MITGKAGYKQVAHVEKIFSARRVSVVTIKSRGMSELSKAIKSIDSSYVSGLKDYGRVVLAVQRARTPAAKKTVQTRLREVNSRLNQLSARKKKALALVRMIKKL